MTTRGLRIRLCPTRQHLPKRVVRADLVERAAPDLADERVVKRVAGRTSERAEDGSRTLMNVLARRLTHFDVDVHAAELSVGIQLIPQREQRRCLAPLARRVQGEVLSLPDQEQEIVNVEARQGLGTR